MNYYSLINRDLKDLEKISRDADVNSQNVMGVTALMHACEMGCYENVKYLISCGANVNAADSWGNTALHIALNKNKMDIVNLLLSNGADRNIKNHFMQRAADHKNFPAW